MSISYLAYDLNKTELTSFFAAGASLCMIGKSLKMFQKFYIRNAYMYVLVLDLSSVLQLGILENVTLGFPRH